MPIRLILCLLLTIGGLVWTEHHASTVQPLNSRRSGSQQGQPLAAESDSDSNKEKPSPGIKWRPGQRSPTRRSKSVSTYADKQRRDTEAVVQ
jgi:hypothetical protein